MRRNKNTWFYIGGSGLDRTDDFQKFCGSRLDRIQFYRIRTGLGLKKFTVRSSLVAVAFFFIAVLLLGVPETRNLFITNQPDYLWQLVICSIWKWMCYRSLLRLYRPNLFFGKDGIWWFAVNRRNCKNPVSLVY